MATNGPTWRWLYVHVYAGDRSTDQHGAEAESHELLRLRMQEQLEAQAAAKAEWMSRMEQQQQQLAEQPQAEHFHAAALVPWWREAIRTLAARDTCTGA